MFKPDAEDIKGIINRPQELQTDRQLLQKALQQIPIIDPERVQSAAQLLFQMVCYTLGTDAFLLQKQRKLWQERGVLAEAISQRKASQMRNLNFYTIKYNAEKTAKTSKSGASA
jgi:ribosomal protein L15E